MDRKTVGLNDAHSMQILNSMGKLLIEVGCNNHMFGFIKTCTVA